MMKRNYKGYGWEKESSSMKGVKLDTQGCKLQKLERHDILLYSDKSTEENDFLVWMISHPIFIPRIAELDLEDKWYVGYTGYARYTNLVYLYKNNILRVYQNRRQINMYTNIPAWKKRWKDTIGERVGKQTGIL